MDPKQPVQRANKTSGDGCEFQSRLGAFHDGELDADAERIDERHLALCEACRAELQGIRELSDMAGQIGLDGMSPVALRRLHRAIDRQRQYASVFRIAGVLTGLAASAMVVGAAWLWDAPGSGYRSQPKIVRIEAGPTDKWEYLAMNLNSDPLSLRRIGKSMTSKC